MTQVNARRERRRQLSRSNPGMSTYRGGGRAMFGHEWRPGTCQYLFGEPKERNFCGEPVKPGSSYCAKHHAACWYGVPEDGDD